MFYQCLVDKPFVEDGDEYNFFIYSPALRPLFVHLTLLLLHRTTIPLISRRWAWWVFKCLIYSRRCYQTFRKVSLAYLFISDNEQGREGFSLVDSYGCPGSTYYHNRMQAPFSDILEWRRRVCVWNENFPQNTYLSTWTEEATQVDKMRLSISTFLLFGGG